MDSYCEKRVEDVSIVGYYQANEVWEDKDASGICTKIADSMKQNNDDTIILVVSSEKVHFHSL